MAEMTLERWQSFKSLFIPNKKPLFGEQPQKKIEPMIVVETVSGSRHRVKSMVYDHGEAIIICSDKQRITLQATKELFECKTVAELQNKLIGK